MKHTNPWFNQLRLDFEHRWRSPRVGDHSCDEWRFNVADLWKQCRIGGIGLRIRLIPYNTKDRRRALRVPIVSLMVELLITSVQQNSLKFAVRRIKAFDHPSGHEPAFVLRNQH